ncbi:MAG TPA: lysyl oxidase family protein [Candidatus Margulisiibacteriota bacterium]|nr:lysyl oxidase family protein [Candidatus Margulisiibacteriota bacterium]
MMRALLATFGAVALLGTASYGQPAELNLPPHPTLPECQRTDPKLVLPDLVPEVPSDVRTISRGTYREMDFTSAIGNIGAGPLILEGITVSDSTGVHTAAYQHINRTDGSQCAHTAGLFVYHPQHAHWHFDRFIGYELRSDDPYTGPLATIGEKMSFCLLDIQPVRGFNPLQYPRQVLTQTCNSAEGIVGISVGWEDVYERFLPGQNINLDIDSDHQVPVGSYFLINHVNPDGRIWESNLDNNTSFATVNVSLSPKVLQGPVATPGPSPTPAGPAANPQRPHLRPGRIRPTRAARVPRGGADATPTRTRPGDIAPTPTRTRPVDAAPTPTAVQDTGSTGPHRPHTPAGANPPVARQPRPTPLPHLRPGQVPSTPTPEAAPVPGCENACAYDVSQLRLTWYDQLGLTFQGFVNGGSAGCPRLQADAGVSGMMVMANWLNARKQDLGLDHSMSYVLGDGADGATSDGGDFSLSAKSNGMSFTYKAPLAPPAHTSDGFEGTPVAFEACLTVGNNAVKIRMVCQAHSQGLLCHEG